MEIAADQIGMYSTPFVRLPAAWAVASIAAGNTAGRLWQVGGALLLWDQGNEVLYLAGDVLDEPTRQALTQLIGQEIHPAALEEGLSHLKLRAQSPALEAAIPALLPGIALHEVLSVVYLHQGDAPKEQPEPDLAGFRFLTIDRALLEESGLWRAEEALAEIRWMWTSLERFYALGFGVAAGVPGELIGWCTAEYVSPGRCGAGIATVPAFQRRGVALALAARFVEECRARGVQPLWETAVDNVASRRTAERVGFSLAEEARGWLMAVQ